MLYWLFQELSGVDSGFNVFGYITLRTVLSALTALMIAACMPSATEVGELSLLAAGPPYSWAGP